MDGIPPRYHILQTPTAVLVALCLLQHTATTTTTAENILQTEVFAITVDPFLFNWTAGGLENQFVFTPSLARKPDLPKWINYVYSERNSAGYLYGVPPPDQDSNVELEIVGLNRENYETKRLPINIQIAEKLSPAKREVQLKIDNLNVEDMFEVERMERLKDVFRKKLWPDSQNDLYVTFLASAIQMGARRPLKPNEGEGVVIRVGSAEPLSAELYELQEEVRPLWKVPSCPRDFKRTTVERFFRDSGFVLDWCAFKLFEESEIEAKSASNAIPEMRDAESLWESISKDDVPERSYSGEAIFTIVLPMCILIVLVLLLTFIFCFYHEDFSQKGENPLMQDMRRTTDNYAPTYTLRSLSVQRDYNSLSPTAFIGSSPTGTILKGVHCRPSPPPYVRPPNKESF